VKRLLGLSLSITVGLLILFYVGVWLLPRFVHWVAARSLYNYRDLAEQAIARRDYDGAVAVIERASREIPRDIYFERPEYMFDWIGRIRKQQGRTAESLQAFLRAQASFFLNIQLRGYLPPIRLIQDILEGYFVTGNPAGAFEEARVALDLYPMLKDRFLQPHSQRVTSGPLFARDMGILYLKAGRTVEGQARLRESLQKNPRLPDSHFWLGRIEEDLRSANTAIREYEAELAVNAFAENALLRLIHLGNQTHSDTASLAQRLDQLHSLAFVEYLPDAPGEPLASLWGIGSKLQLAFTLPEPSDLLVNILARSTPCFGLYGWVEFILDGRHVQNVYVDSLELQVYAVRLNHVEAGRHIFRIEVLSDATDGQADRNTFIHNIRIYRLPADSP